MKGMKIAIIIAVALLAISCTTTSESQMMDMMDSNVLVEKGVSVEMLSSEDDFLVALGALGLSVADTEIVDGEVLTLDEAVGYVMSAVGMTELAWTFPEEKYSSLLAGFEVMATGAEKVDQLATTALTIGLVDASWYNENVEEGDMSSDDMGYLLEAAASFKGITKDYLGMISDDSIYASILDSWNNYSIVQNNALVDIVDEGVIQGITTGYNVVKKADNPTFDEVLTINYGHSDIKHALQLVGLLKSEGIDAKVDFQGKTSAFLYLEEWGTPTESEDFKVKQIPNGNYVAYSKEYNIYFEFENTADKAAFDSIILAYAKKDSSDEPGLIYASWWQPLYSSTVEMGEGYYAITDNVISYGIYEAHPFALNENVEASVMGFKAIDPTLEIDSRMFWVNHAFYNYLGGTDFK